MTAQVEASPARGGGDTEGVELPVERPLFGGLGRIAAALGGPKVRDRPLSNPGDRAAQEPGRSTRSSTTTFGVGRASAAIPGSSTAGLRSVTTSRSGRHRDGYSWFGVGVFWTVMIYQ